MIQLPLSKCVIRSWQRRDAASIARHANDRLVWRNLKDKFPHPYTLADAERWITEASAVRPESHFAIVVDGEAVGGIGLLLWTDVFRRTAEIGFWLGRTYWGQGIMTEAVRALTDLAFAQCDLCRIEAGVFEWNPASARVLEKAGYTLEARLRKRITKDGQTVDELLYARIEEGIKK